MANVIHSAQMLHCLDLLNTRAAQVLAFVLVLATPVPLAAFQNAVPKWGYQVVNTYPHDPAAFTEGLFYLGGFLYEGTGNQGKSSIRKVKLETGEVIQKHDIPSTYFGEGIVHWKGKLFELTWKSQKGFIYDLKTFASQGTFSYTGQGWALTQDGAHIIMSDGTPVLRFLDPETLTKTAELLVKDRGVPVKELNELEWVKGEIFANVYQTNTIARIDPASGTVVGWIDLTGIAPVPVGPNNVLNGIAYDSAGDRLFVTGKLWPKLFQIRLVKKQ